MKISAHFHSEEFIPKRIHNYIVSHGWDPRWWIRENKVRLLEHLKAYFSDKYGEEVIIAVNTYKWGGQRNWSGLRTWLARFKWSLFEYGNSLSQHRFMNAVDIQMRIKRTKRQISPLEIANYIEANFKKLNKEFKITTIEDPSSTPTWNHLDWRWTGLEYLLIVRP